MSDSAKWIVSMIGNKSSSLKYLNDLLISIKYFYYPSNRGDYQKDLIRFLLRLTENFLDRIYL